MPLDAPTGTGSINLPQKQKSESNPNTWRSTIPVPAAAMAKSFTDIWLKIYFDCYAEHVKQNSVHLLR